MTVLESTAHDQVMHEIDRTERQYKKAFIAAVGLEVVLLAALLLLTVLEDGTQALLLVGFVGSYSIVVLALVALGVHVSRVGQRVVRAETAVRR